MLFAFLHKNRSKEAAISRLVKRLFYTRLGQILISILFGVALAFVFQKACKGKKCYVFEAPPMEELNGHIYRIGKDCYKYVPRVVACEDEDEEIEIELDDASH